MGSSMTTMLIAGLILAISMAAVLQFGLLYWRSVLHAAAAVPLASGVEALVEGEGNATAFEWNRACPDLSGESPSSDWRMNWVRTYFRGAELLGRVLPGLKEWAAGEMVSSARYAALLVTDRVERNRRYAAEMLS